MRRPQILERYLQMYIVHTTKCVGEWFDEIDWNYDFTKHDWTNGRGGGNPICSAEGKAILKKIVDNPGNWFYSPAGIGWRKIVYVGMYDGWPFWEPTPAIGYIGALGTIEVAFYYNLHEGNCHESKRKETSD